MKAFLFGIIFSFKTCSSPLGLFASGLILQGFHFREWKPLFGIIFSFKALSSTLGFFASGLILQGFDRLEARIGKQVDEYGRLAL